MKYVSVGEMIAIEREADRSGLTYAMMMDNAGLGLAHVVDERYRHRKPGPILGLIGSGNNGGDTLVALALLTEWGWKTQAYLTRPRPFEDPLISRFKDGGGDLIDSEFDPSFAKLASLIHSSSVLLDGILGTGFRLPLRGKIAELLAATGKLLSALSEPPVVIAVDCPSGVDCDSGEAAKVCLPAALTVTMAAVKMGLLKFPAYNFVGDLQLVGIGLPDSLNAWRSIQRFVVDKTYVQRILPERRLDANKGTFGTALVLGGSVNYTGAVILAGEAAYRIGAGLVTLGIPEPLHKMLSGHFLEATWLPLPHEGGSIAESAYNLVMQNLNRPTAILIGPGLGLSDTTRRFLSHFLIEEHPQIPFEGKNHRDLLLEQYPALSRLVIDADGLKLLASHAEWYKRLPSPVVLTPHPGEMAVLTGLSVAEIQADRLGVAEYYAQTWGHVIILKGAFSVIASPDKVTAVVPVATPALARAGTGDILAGLVVGLRAQGVDAFPSAAAASWIHARGGLNAAEKLGSTTAVLAGDVLQSVVKILAEINNR